MIIKQRNKMRTIKQTLVALTLGLFTLTSCEKEVETVVCEHQNTVNNYTADIYNYQKGDKLALLYVSGGYTPTVNWAPSRDLDRDNINDSLWAYEKPLNIDSTSYGDKIVYTYLIRKDSIINLQLVNENGIPIHGPTNYTDFIVTSRNVYTSSTNNSCVVKAKYPEQEYYYITNYYDYINNEDFTPLKGYSDIGVCDATQPAISSLVYRDVNISSVESGQ